MTATWRLLDSGSGGAAWNMAVDEAVLQEYAAGEAAPTLRFYQWDPPALSLGRFQDPPGEASLDALRREGFAWVRRPTGGRAVLHWRDLTYAVVVGEDFLRGSVVETYRRLSAALVAGLRLLGVRAELAGEKAGEAGVDPACFAVPSSYELLVNGKKLVGSAQVRRKGAILQHGSLLLDFDPLLLARVTAPPEAVTAQAALYAARVTSLREVLGAVPPYGELVRAMTGGFAGTLGVTFHPGTLTAAEEDRAAGLAGRCTEAG